MFRISLRRLERVFRCFSVCETMKDYKEGYLIVWTNYISPCSSIVELYLRVLVTSYQLPWQQTRATKLSFKFQFLPIICKSSSVTYHFYLFVGKFPKLFNFSDGKEKSYLVELNIFKENAFYGLQKILLDNFPRNFYIWSAIVNGTCMQKIKIGHRAKFRARSKCFLQILFPVRAILRSI